MDSIVSLQLINTDNQQVIPSLNPLIDGAVLNLAVLPSRNLNINAHTNPGKVGSVQFILDGKVHIENFQPYAWAGDIQGKFIGWTPNIGNHTLIVTPFSQINAGGVAGTPLTVGFSVVDIPAQPTPPPTVIPAFIYNGSANITFDGQNFTITIKGAIQQ